MMFGQPPVHVDTDPREPDVDRHDDGDDGSDDTFFVIVSLYPPGTTPNATASITLSPDAPADDVAAALLRSVTAAAQAHSSDLAMAVHRQLYAGGRP